MTDTIMENQNNVDAQESENLNTHMESRILKSVTVAASIAAAITIAAGAYYAYGLLFPDPWYIRALAIFGF